MLVSVLLSGLVLGFADPGVGPTAEDRAAYTAEQAKVGRDAAAHVRLALWCESRGMMAERTRELSLAVLNQPGNAMARGLLGLVEYKGRWQRPESVAEKVEADVARATLMKEYLDRRAKAADTPDAQWKLALWCEENGLKAESIAHFRAVIRLDPGRESAWKHLGFKKVNGRWAREADLAAEKEAAATQKQADKHWRPILESTLRKLNSANASVRLSADESLSQITDPLAVPSLWATFAAKPNAERQALAVRTLGQIDAAGSSRALALLAVSGASAEVRRAATETLKRRDVREFADLLIALIRDPIKYEVDPVHGPNQSGSISIRGKKANIKRIYTPPPVAVPTILPTDQLAFDPNTGLPVILRPFATQNMVDLPPREIATGNPPIGSRQRQSMSGVLYGPNGMAGLDIDGLPAGQYGPYITATPGGGAYKGESVDLVRSNGVLQIPVGQIAVESQKAQAAARQKLDTDIDAMESYNADVRKSNSRVVPVLAAVAGTNLGDDRDAWGNWWVSQIGMRILPLLTADTPTLVEQVPIDFQPQPIAPTTVVNTYQVQRLVSCFGGGTMVKTLTGSTAIESLRPGDVVLTQNIKSGKLGYQPVVKVHHNPPSETFRVGLENGETIVSSAFHRFWKAGAGWVMARDLTAGDTLRTLGGLTKVAVVENDQVQPVFNLDIADDADFFVGSAGTLVHDNTLPDLRLAPFDAPVVASAKRSGSREKTTIARP